MTRRVRATVATSQPNDHEDQCGAHPRHAATHRAAPAHIALASTRFHRALPTAQDVGELPGNQRGTWPAKFTDVHVESGKVPRSQYPESGLFVAWWPIQTVFDAAKSPFPVYQRGTNGGPIRSTWTARCMSPADHFLTQNETAPRQTLRGEVRPGHPRAKGPML